MAFNELRFDAQKIPVAEINLDKQTSSISTIGEMFAEDRVPLGIPIKKGKIDRGSH